MVRAAPWEGVGRGLLLLFFAFTTVLLVRESLPYFTFTDDLPFFLEKWAAYESVVWRVAFYLHVGGGIVCLVVALPQFSKTLLRRAPRVHRFLGWSYVVSVLGFTVPAGLYLALFAKGGVPGRLGFILLGIALLYTTWRGLERVLAKDFRGHAAWMIRSYAMAASALTFRVFYVLLSVGRVDDAYVISIWLSLIVNLIGAEAVIARKRKGATT